MTFLTDPERLFAANQPIGFAAVAAVAALMAAAFRGAWRTLRGHHLRLAAATALALLTAMLPSGNALLSPIANRVEPPEMNLLAAPVAAQSPVVATGAFYGVDELHYGSGAVSVVETAPGTFVVNLDLYSVAPGPDLYIYLSPSATGYAEGALELGTLTATSGALSYAVPAGIDPRAYGSVLIWCKQFAFLFATAPLTAV